MSNHEVNVEAKLDEIRGLLREAINKDKTNRMGMELWRPDWFKIMKGCTFDNLHANELVSVTKETARLALSALRQKNAEDYYHNNGAAAGELQRVLE